MTKISLKSKLRDVVGRKVKQRRKEEEAIPAIVYGYGIENKNIWVDYVDFSRVYKEAGENTIIELDVDGKKLSTLVYDTQVDPISGDFSHIDFFKVQMGEKIESDIPVEFLGEAPAVKELGGTFVKNMDEIPVRCLPGDLPSKFELDLSTLKSFDDYLKIKDIPTSDKVEILLESDTIIALVSEPRSEEEMSELNEKVEEDVSKVEGVEKKEEAEAGAEEKSAK